MILGRKCPDLLLGKGKSGKKRAINCRKEWGAGGEISQLKRVGINLWAEESGENAIKTGEFGKNC